MKKQLVIIAVLGFLGGFAGAAPVYNSEGPSGSSATGGYRESTYSAMRPNDFDLSRAARRSLERDTNLSTQAKNINIKVKNGQATLSGAVMNANEISVIRKKVMAVEGIHSVNSKLKIQE